MASRIFALIILAAVNICISLVASETCDSRKCPTTPKHYEELGCKAIRKPGECCTSSFDCPKLIDQDNGKCYYKNKILVPGEILQNFQQSDTCEAKCYCNLNRGGGPSEMVCTRLKCNEKPRDQTIKYCVKQYEHKSCCSVKSVCDDDINKLAACEFEGRHYFEGERMYPRNHCYKCFCARNFNNQTSVPDNKNCHKIDCGIALTKTVRLSEGCIPVYIKTDDCCPIGWRCPGEKHMKPEKSKSVESKEKCRFGNMFLKVGESLDLGGDNCQNCTCSMPPMLHCIQTC